MDMAAVFEHCESAVSTAVPLAPETSFRIGGPAQYLIEPRTVEELATLVRRCLDAGVPIRVLGGGSNILVPDEGIPGAVFRLSRMCNITRSGTRLLCEAGAPLSHVVRRAEQWGLSGLESLAGIPGYIGGAVAMNAGGKHGCVASVLSSVTTLDRSGLLHEREPQTLRLGYRCSHLGGEVVLRAEFRLTEQDPLAIAETRIAVLEDKAKTQPLSSFSAGCIFKNPGEQGAGLLIDLAGLKGQRVGRAVVSAQHANFIINEGGATAQDVRTLIARVQDGVRKSFGVELELEIELWN